MILSALTDVPSSQEMATKDKSCYPHKKKINLHLKPYIHSPGSPSLRKIRPAFPLQHGQPNMNRRFCSYIYLPPRTIIGYVAFRSLSHILCSKHLAHLLLLWSLREYFCQANMSVPKYIWEEIHVKKKRLPLVCAYPSYRWNYPETTHEELLSSILY